MCQHEIKNCQRCNTVFECKPGSITQCQCFEIVLTTEQRAFLEQRFTDCLCNNCLVQVQSGFDVPREKITD